MKFLAETNDEPQFLVAPLIDIIFLLLIFFVTTSALETFEKDVSIDLPKGDIPALGVDAKQTVYVEVDANGAVKLEGRAITAEDMKHRMAALVEMNPRINVVLRADKGVAWQAVVNAIEIATGAGVTNLFYAISGRTEEPAK